MSRKYLNSPTRRGSQRSLTELWNDPRIAGAAAVAGLGLGSLVLITAWLVGDAPRSTTAVRVIIGGLAYPALGVGFMGLFKWSRLYQQAHQEPWIETSGTVNAVYPVEHGYAYAYAYTTHGGITHTGESAVTDQGKLPHLHAKVTVRYDPRHHDRSIALSSRD